MLVVVNRDECVCKQPTELNAKKVDEKTLETNKYTKDTIIDAFLAYSQTGNVLGYNNSQSLGSDGIRTRNL